MPYRAPETFTDTGTALALNTVLLQADVSEFNYGVFQMAAPATMTLPSSGSLLVEGSVDKVNWFTVPYSVLTSGAVSSANLLCTTAGAWMIPMPFNWIRFRVTVILGSRPVNPFLHLRAVDAAIPNLLPTATPISYTQGALVAGSALIGGTRTDSAGTVGGLLVHRLASAAGSVNNTLILTGVRRIYKIRGRNAAAALRYLKIYNKATAPATGTDTPAFVCELPLSAPFEIDFGSIGVSLALGLGYGLCTGIADADATAVTAADILNLHIFYA